MKPNDAVKSLCEERLATARAYRSKYESDWYLNLAFFEGDQWCAWDGRGLFKPRLDPGRITLTDNRVQPIIRTEVAKMSKARPGWSATPRSADDNAITDAISAERLLEWGYDHLHFAAARREALLWSRICSAGFIKTTWDPTVGGGAEVLVGPDGPLINPQSKRVIKAGEFPELEELEGVTRQRIGEGEVVLTVRSPFDIFPDPLATSLDDSRWLIDEAVRSPEYVEERYKQKIAPDAPAQPGIVQGRYTGQSGKLVGVRVYEMWERATAAKPEGRHVVWTASGILADEGNPYEGLPYAMVPGVTVPGRFWPDSVTTQLRPVQARMNKLLSQIAENASKFGNPSLLLDNLSNAKYHGVPGEVIYFNGTSPTARPDFLVPPSMPQYVFTLLAQCDQSMREISGQFEISQGNVPSGVTAASAISLLTEQDATRIGPDVEALEGALATIGQQVLTLMARYYTTERVTVITGEDGVPDISTFRTSNAFQIPNVKVQPGSTFPRSLAARQAAIRDVLNMMLQYGVPITGDALASTLRDMQVGGLEHIVQGFTADQGQIAREHADFFRGGELLLGPVDNDGMHISSHEEVAKSARFRALPGPQRDALYAHIDAHRARGAAAAGPPPGPGGIVNPGGAPPPPGAVPTQPSGNPAGAFNVEPTV